MRGRDQKPRLVVFGDAGWVGNRQMAGNRVRGNYELFAYTLAWLRERPTTGNFADPKERAFFTLANQRPETITRLYFTPALVLFAGILGVGGGIWLARRR
jgi:hypothetical protein